MSVRTSEACADLLEGEREIHVMRAGQQVRHATLAQECEVLVGHALGENGDDVIAVDVVGLPREATARIDGEGERVVRAGCDEVLARPPVCSRATSASARRPPANGSIVMRPQIQPSGS
jgi:hypothetical protein